MLAVSTAWNAARHTGWEAAVNELVGLRRSRVVLDGAALHPDASEAGRAARHAHGEVVAVCAPRVEKSCAVGGLAAPRDEIRRAALQNALRTAQCARAAGTGRVILRVGEVPSISGGPASWTGRLRREGVTAEIKAEVAAAVTAVHADRVRFLEALCRSLFELCRADAEITWLLETPSAPLGLPWPSEALDVFAELPGRRLGWWHDAGWAAALHAHGCVEAEEWLTLLGTRTHGVTVTDWSPSGVLQPPGSGLVDWAALRTQLSPQFERVVSLEDVYPPALLLDALREADALLPA